MFESRYPLMEQVLEGRASQRSKLLRLYEIMLLEPWDQIRGAPMVAEFYEGCTVLLPEVEAKHEAMRLRYTQAIVGKRELAEVFLLAVDGLQSDLPTTVALRRRLVLLIERFVPAEVEVPPPPTRARARARRGSTRLIIHERQLA